MSFCGFIYIVFRATYATYLWILLLVTGGGGLSCVGANTGCEYGSGIALPRNLILYDSCYPLLSIAFFVLVNLLNRYFYFYNTETIDCWLRVFPEILQRNYQSYIQDHHGQVSRTRAQISSYLSQFNSDCIGNGTHCVGKLASVCSLTGIQIN
jgi:hypothetical protein